MKKLTIEPLRKDEKNKLHGGFSSIYLPKTSKKTKNNNCAKANADENGNCGCEACGPYHFNQGGPNDEKFG